MAESKCEKGTVRRRTLVSPLTFLRSWCLRLYRNVQVAATLGFPIRSAANDPTAPAAACTLLDATIDRSKHRCSTDSAFLPRSIAAKRRNLTICVGTIVTLLDVRQTEGEPRVVGVYIEADSGETKQLRVSAAREVVLCAGAIPTPKLLLLRCVAFYQIEPFVHK